MGVEGYNSEQMERLKDYKVAFDQEAMWAELQKKKKKRRGAFFFITMALVALAIVFFASQLLGWQKGDLEDKNNEWSSLNDNKNNNSTISERAPSEITKSKLDAGNVYENAGIEADGSLVENSDISNEGQLDSGPERTNTSIDTKRTVSDNTRSSSSGDIVQNNRTAQTHNASQIKQSKEVSNQRNDFVSIPLGNENNSTRAASKTSQTEEKENNKAKADNSININKISILDFPFLESLINDKLKLDHLKVIAALTPPIIKPLKNYKWFAGGYGGAGYAMKRIDREIATETNDRTLEEVSIGLELKYQIRPSLYLSTGLEYWHVTDRRSKDRSFSIKSINEEIRIMNDLEETAEGFLVTISESVKHTMYQTLNVPLMAGYNTNNEHFNLFAEAGAMYNFNVFSRGDLPEYQREFFIGSRSQIAPQFGLGASYRWTNGLELFTRANWRGNQHVTKSVDGEFGVQEKYSAIRGQVGLRLGF